MVAVALRPSMEACAASPLDARDRRLPQDGEGGARSVFVALPDVLHGLIASHLDKVTMLSLCACSRFLAKTYSAHVASLALMSLPVSIYEIILKIREEEEAQEEEGAEALCGGSRTTRGAQLSRSRVTLSLICRALSEKTRRSLARFQGLRSLRLMGDLILGDVAAALRASGGREGGAGSGALLHQLQHLEAKGPTKAVHELLLALAATEGGGATCVCPGLQHLLLGQQGPYDADLLEVLVDVLIGREEAGAASLLTLQPAFYVDYERGGGSREGLLLSRLLLTSKSCESLKALVMASYLKGDCLRVMEAYLSSGRAASLRRLCCGWGDDSPDGRPTIPAALAAGQVPLLEDVDLTVETMAPVDEVHLVQWAASPWAARMVSLRLQLSYRVFSAVLRAAVDSHGLPRLRMLRICGYRDDDTAMLAVVDGMEAPGALACLECLEVPWVGEQGIRRLAAFLAEGRGCSRTLRRLDLVYSTATDEAGAQLGRAMQAGGLTALEELILDNSEAWGDATVCAMVEALEMGKGRSLKVLSMDWTALQRAGHERMCQAVKVRLHEGQHIQFKGCLSPLLQEHQPSVGQPDTPPVTLPPESWFSEAIQFVVSVLRVILDWLLDLCGG